MHRAWPRAEGVHRGPEASRSRIREALGLIWMPASISAMCGACS
jgi:hypothetical protein